ncbi:putative transmembrane protein [Toxoplasma gondii GAB2-2007-GAL-DOM2]|uniref:Putative transmembrane protein n=1 Tax=Toxoplasma gondii GAB2-2007-GAL-DOM2 TaxID=1130820 RepID=A0A086KWZ1_TOXGO|nr:putative transmembrane protein [Toxoplasma gondii GAB2-2007-GAL-DOM2]
MSVEVECAGVFFRRGFSPRLFTLLSSKSISFKRDTRLLGRDSASPSVPSEGRDIPPWKLQVILFFFLFSFFILVCVFLFGNAFAPLEKGLGGGKGFDSRRSTERSRARRKVFDLPIPTTPL